MPASGSMSNLPGAAESTSARWPTAMRSVLSLSRCAARRAAACAWCPRGSISQRPNTPARKASCRARRGCALGSVRSSHCSTGLTPGRRCTTIGTFRRDFSACRFAAWRAASAAAACLASVERESTRAYRTCSSRGKGGGHSCASVRRMAHTQVTADGPRMSDFSGYPVAALVRDTLERCGARAAFGLPGGANRELFLALRGSKVRLVVPSHELAAAFMAGSYGRVSGRPGVLLTIPGPGFAYALAGIAEAWQDSAPLVHIVHAPPGPPHQRLRLQALDQSAIAAPMVKAVFCIEDPAQLLGGLEEAFEAARSGEPGPVLVQLGAAPSRAAVPPPRPDERELAALWQRVARARRPVLWLGQGCAGAAAAVRRYIERTGTPAFSTASGRGVLSEASSLNLGYDSLRGTTAALNEFLDRCDLVLAVGARLAYNGSAGFGVQ